MNWCLSFEQEKNSQTTNYRRLASTNQARVRGSPVDKFVRVCVSPRKSISHQPHPTFHNHGWRGKEHAKQPNSVPPPTHWTTPIASHMSHLLEHYATRAHNSTTEVLSTHLSWVVNYVHLKPFFQPPNAVAHASFFTWKQPPTPINRLMTLPQTPIWAIISLQHKSTTQEYDFLPAWPHLTWMHLILSPSVEERQLSVIMLASSQNTDPTNSLTWAATLLSSEVSEVQTNTQST